jgi:RNA polymerase sigma-70 factor (ECF subfamily)
VLELPGPLLLADACAVGPPLPRGDGGDLDELFRLYRGVAYRVAYRLLGNEADALDAVQDGFVKVLRNVDRFRGRCALKTWVLRVVSNAALDVGRQRRRRYLRLNAAAAGKPDSYDPSRELSDLDRSDLRGLVSAALAELPEAQRQTFVLHVEGGLSYRDVSEALNIPIGTVMSRLFFARKKLQTLLADRVCP